MPTRKLVIDLDLDAATEGHLDLFQDMIANQYAPGEVVTQRIPGTSIEYTVMVTASEIVNEGEVEI